ncbi:MAG: hypothetical protein ABS35_40030 [Kaistia sp. SCN 65-12]|nr:MAG: hypothetical protein ABS35_40030 [Kaistia sp. SCN 65-12]
MGWLVASAASPLIATVQFSDPERQHVEAAATSMLSRARLGHSTTNARGRRRVPIVIGDEQVGNLWEDVDLKVLLPGNFWDAGSGKRVELLLQGRVVGIMRLHNE